jgi:hypothetical protein
LPEKDFYRDEGDERDELSSSLLSPSSLFRFLLKQKEKGPLTGKGNGPISSYFYPISSQEHCADMTFTSVPTNR